MMTKRPLPGIKGRPVNCGSCQLLQADEVRIFGPAAQHRDHRQSQCVKSPNSLIRFARRNDNGISMRFFGLLFSGSVWGAQVGARSPLCALSFDAPPSSGSRTASGTRNTHRVKSRLQRP